MVHRHDDSDAPASDCDSGIPTSDCDDRLGEAIEIYLALIEQGAAPSLRRLPRATLTLVKTSARRSRVWS